MDNMLYQHPTTPAAGGDSGVEVNSQALQAARQQAESVRNIARNVMSRTFSLNTTGFLEGVRQTGGE